MTGAMPLACCALPTIEMGAPPRALLCGHEGTHWSWDNGFGVGGGRGEA